MCARRDLEYLGNTIPDLRLIKRLEECWIVYGVFWLMVPPDPILKAFPIHRDSVRNGGVDEANQRRWNAIVPRRSAIDRATESVHLL